MKTKSEKVRGFCLYSKKSNLYVNSIYFILLSLITFIVVGLSNTISNTEVVNESQSITYSCFTEETSSIDSVNTNALNLVDDQPTIETESLRIVYESTTIKATETNTSKYEEDKYGKYYWFKASCTAYCSCEKCCGKYAANRQRDENNEPIVLTASGSRAKSKYTISMSSNFEFGTKVYIDGIGLCEVMDRGSAVKGNVIDIYFDSHEEALNFGRHTINVKIYV